MISQERFSELVAWFRSSVDLKRMADNPNQEFHRLAWKIRHSQVLTIAEQRMAHEFIDELTEAAMQAAWEEFYTENK